jgi:hypothetical protein
MFNPNRLLPKYNAIKTISNFNKNKKLYQQIVSKNKKPDYNKILKRNFCSSASAGECGGGGGGNGNDYWKLIAMAVSAYFISNINKPPPPPPTPFEDIQWNLLTKKYI